MPSSSLRKSPIGLVIDGQALAAAVIGFKGGIGILFLRAEFRRLRGFSPGTSAVLRAVDGGAEMSGADGGQESAGITDILDDVVNLMTEEPGFGKLRTTVGFHRPGAFSGS
jgi:hypothetical protein